MMFGLPPASSDAISLDFLLPPVAHTNELTIRILLNAMPLNKNATRAVVTSCAIASLIAVARSQGMLRTCTAVLPEYR